MARQIYSISFDSIIFYQKHHYVLLFKHFQSSCRLQLFPVKLVGGLEHILFSRLSWEFQSSQLTNSNLSQVGVGLVYHQPQPPRVFPLLLTTAIIVNPPRRLVSCFASFAQWEFLAQLCQTMDRLLNYIVHYYTSHVHTYHVNSCDTLSKHLVTG